MEVELERVIDEIVALDLFDELKKVVLIGMQVDELEIVLIELVGLVHCLEMVEFEHLILYLEFLLIMQVDEVEVEVH